MFRFSRRKKVEVHQHWYVPLLGFRVSTQEFYSAIEKELTERGVPGLEISRVEFAEGGLLSAQREYLRLRRERLIFDICSAPFGTSWFFSFRAAIIPRVFRLWELAVIVGAVLSLFFLYWLTFGLFVGTIVIAASLAAVLFFLSIASQYQGLDDALILLPILGKFYEVFFRRDTYYRHDSELMYLEIIPYVVRQQVMEFAKAAGRKESEIKSCSTCKPPDIRDLLPK